MRKATASEKGILRPRVLLAVICLLAIPLLLAVFGFAAAPSGGRADGTARSASAAPPAPDAVEDCINAPAQVVTDPTGDQGAANPSQVDIQSVSVGEDYRFIGNPRLVFKMKVVDLNSIPPDEFWRVRFTFTPPGGTATTYQINMTSDANGIVNFDYGTVANSMVTTIGPIDAGSYTSDGVITMVINMNKVGNPVAGSQLAGVNGLTQKNNGGVLFTGQDSTSSANYTVRPMAGACTPVPLPPPPGAATYLKGGISFSPNYTTKAPFIGQDVEPSIRTDKFGNTYAAPIRGLTGGTDLWYFDHRPTVGGAPNPTYDPFMRNAVYRGQPDSISGSEDVVVGGDGGGDVDMAVSFNPEAIENPASPPALAYSSLLLANISTQRSLDRGASFTKNPAGNITGGVPGDDRQWMEFFGVDNVYIIYRTAQPAIAQVQRSIDRGLTYGNTSVVGTIGQVGGVDVDQNDGTVYLSGSNGVVAVGIPPVPGPPGPTSLPPVTYTIYNVAGTGNNHIFFTVKVANDGTAYACYSNGDNIYIRYTKDKGETWSPAIRVSDGPETATSIFPWLETGPAGMIGVVWYGTDKATSSDDTADWKVFYALGTGVTSGSPTFQQAVASDHVIHGANISESGLVVGGMSPNRNLADYFQVSFDPTGAATIAYCDDHNDFSAHLYVTRQISGPGLNNGVGIPTPVEGSALPAPSYEPLPTAASQGGIPGSQVSDFRQDVRAGGNPQTGGPVVVAADDPLDIQSVLYSTEGTAQAPVLVGTMKVSLLTVIPPSSNWRINFAANAPDSVLSPTGEYTFGISDRADQFFMRATTDAAGAQTFVYGTAKREFNGSITYTDKGAADFGAFDQVNGTIVVKVAVSKLNTALAAGRPQLAMGTILTGLRASTFTTAQGSGNNRTDSARGGTQYPISFPLTGFGAVSTKSHGGGAATYSVALPAGNQPGIECRSGGVNGDYTVVVTFPNQLSSVVGASVTSGTGKVTAGTINNANPQQYTVNLTGVADNQVLTIGLHSVNDAQGNHSSLVPVQMRVLIGDTNGDGSVNAGDSTQTRNRAGELTSQGNFRSDVNTDGTINSGDAFIVRSKSGGGGL